MPGRTPPAARQVLKGPADPADPGSEQAAIPETGRPIRKAKNTMNPNSTPNGSPTHPFRRALAILAALALASLAFGVGLPWIIADAPPEAETLWAREWQPRVIVTVTPMTSAVRPPSMR